MTASNIVSNERKRIKFLSWKPSYKKYKARYPDLDKQSFIRGFIACINVLEKDLNQRLANMQAMTRTRCTQCGEESNVMGIGNGCHNENCSGYHVRVEAE